MHVGVMALLQLHSLSEVRHQRVPELFKNIRLARPAVGVGYDLGYIQVNQDLFGELGVIKSRHWSRHVSCLYIIN